MMASDQRTLYHGQDYDLDEESDQIVQFSGQHSYAGGGVGDHYRGDATLPSQSSGPFTISAGSDPHGVRYLADRGPDITSYHTTQQSFAGHDSAAISASPTADPSSMVPAYTNFANPNYATSIPAYSSSAALAHQLEQSQYLASRFAAGFDITTSSILPPPFRSPASHPVHASDPTGYATSATYTSRSQVSPQANLGYSHMTDPGRNVTSSGTLYLSSPGVANFPSNMAANADYRPAQVEVSDDFPWPNLEVLNDTITCDGHPVTPTVSAKVEKGFFKSTTDLKWTCYRRNYFCVLCSYELNPNLDNGILRVKVKGREERIQAIGVRLAAVVDESGGKAIPLIQHTAKRDAGPKSSITVVKVAPTLTNNRNELSFAPQGYGSMAIMQRTPHHCGVQLPLQGRTDSAVSATPQTSHQTFADPYTATGPSHLAAPGQSATHQFERVQFKQATANNGKRRASQQYFHLLVELMVDVRRDGAPEPVWVKVAQRVSEKVVVRGRSPSHYQNEGNHGAVTRHGGTGVANSQYGTPTMPGYAASNPGLYRGQADGYTSVRGNGTVYRPSFQPMPATAEQSESDQESVDAGAMDTDPTFNPTLPPSDRNLSIPEPDGYRYYPAPLYDGVSQNGQPSLNKINGTHALLSEVRNFGAGIDQPEHAADSQWPANGCGKFHGVDSSQGYYPTNMSMGYS